MPVRPALDTDSGSKKWLDWVLEGKPRSTALADATRPDRITPTFVEDEALPLIKAAYDVGIQFFDT